MSACKSGLVALVLLGGFAVEARAQGAVAGTVVSNGFSGGYPGFAAGPGYYGVNGYGFPGGYPGFSGVASSGYGVGVPANRYYYGNPAPFVPQTRNNLGGLMDTIRTQTGPSNSYSYGSNYGAARRRRFR